MSCLKLGNLFKIFKAYQAGINMNKLKILGLTLLFSSTVAHSVELKQVYSLDLQTAKVLASEAERVCKNIQQNNNYDRDDVIYIQRPLLWFLGIQIHAVSSVIL